MPNFVLMCASVFRENLTDGKASATACPTMTRHAATATLPLFQALTTSVPCIPLYTAPASAPSATDDIPSTSKTRRCKVCPLPVSNNLDEACVVHACPECHCGRPRISQARTAHCDRHTCGVNTCSRRREPCRLFCSLHNCSHRGCTKAVETCNSEEALRGYCEEHRCYVNGCPKAHVDWAKHCYAHKCTVYHCNRSVSNLESLLCIKHNESSATQYIRIDTFVHKQLHRSGSEPALVHTVNQFRNADLFSVPASKCARHQSHFDINQLGEVNDAASLSTASTPS